MNGAKLLIATIALQGLACGAACTRGSDAPPLAQRLRVHVEATYPHDATAFTQGLEWGGGQILESTGLNGQSTVRRVALQTGVVELVVALPNEIFAEGLTRVGRNLVQLSWKNGRAIVWDMATLVAVAEFKYEGEGWGLCYDGARLVMSDGSDKLSFRDPNTFEKQGEIAVTQDGVSLGALNELECVDGDVYANLWQTDNIARIDPKTGRVTALIDASGLLSPSERAGADVLNGIAHVRERQRFLLTGKHWPKLFEVTFVPLE
ncbi:MAG: glutaminyl-peptide cyclotransferase [Deltaproteobacteria bacterium]|nr:glutaminyl-peptide cyclotransferase [Deltaproteobacteria bacterium]